MSGGQMRGGPCSWHGTWADDVVLVTFRDAGSGAGGGSNYACLPCARPMAEQDGAPGWLRNAVAAMEKRAAVGAGAAP